MHQHLRQTPRPLNRPASSDVGASEQPPRARSSVDLTQYTDKASALEPARAPERSSMAQQERELTKLNQIIQNFHTKAALTICSSRSHLSQAQTKTGENKQNRWFNLVLDDTDDLLDDLQEWRRPDLSDNRPVPLVIEVFVDTASLTPGQALVITDANEKRWNCVDVLDTSGRAATQQVLLERWTVQLGDAEGYTTAQLSDQLPNVYKKGVVLFRSLYTFLRLLPAWKLHRKLGRQTGTPNALRLKYRIRKGPQGRASVRLTKDVPFPPLCQTDLDTPQTYGTHTYDSLVCPSGPLSISVQYRLNVELSVADSEALLSSRFAGLDAQDRSVYGRSLPGQRSQGEAAYGSIGARVTDSSRLARLAGGGAYGSLGTFHATGKRESPVSALRHRNMSQEDVDDGPSARRPSLAGDSILLRNPPFKAGSYTSSPRGLASPSSSAPRPSAFGTSAPKRLSMNTLPQQALRAPSEHAIASSASASPKPAPVHRYSSSFAGRKRFTSHSSSGKAGGGESITSSGQSSKERSDQALGGEDTSNIGGSSGSGRTDEDDIAAFIKSVEKAKDLTLTSKMRPGSQTINLTKFKGMGIAGGELADEMSTSSLVQTNTPSSGRLSNIPGLSTSGSPGRTLAQQGHAPRVRSRLSTHSIAEVREIGESEHKLAARREEESDDEEPFIFQQDAIA